MKLIFGFYLPVLSWHKPVWDPWVSYRIWPFTLLVKVTDKCTRT